MTSILVIIEKGPTSYGAYSPDIPGVVGLGNTEEEAIQSMKESLQLYAEYMQVEHLPLPETHSHAEYMEIDLS